MGGGNEDEDEDEADDDVAIGIVFRVVILSLRVVDSSHDVLDQVADQLRGRLGVQPALLPILFLEQHIQGELAVKPRPEICGAILQ